MGSYSQKCAPALRLYAYNRTIYFFKKEEEEFRLQQQLFFFLIFRRRNGHCVPFGGHFYWTKLVALAALLR